MKQWVSCFTILLGLVLSICPIKSYAFSTAYGEAYIDLSSLNISVDGDVFLDSYYSYADSYAWLDSDKTGYISDYSNNDYYSYDSYYIVALVEPYGFPSKYSKAEVDYYSSSYDSYIKGYIESTVNADSNGMEWVNLGSDAQLRLQIVSPPDGNGGSFTVSVDYSLELDLTTTDLNEITNGYVEVYTWVEDYDGEVLDWTGYWLDNEVANGDSYYDVINGILETYGYLNPGDSVFVSFSSYADAETYTTAPVPVPSTILLLGSGMLWMVGYRRKCLTKKP